MGKHGWKPKHEKCEAPSFGNPTAAIRITASRSPARSNRVPLRSRRQRRERSACLGLGQLVRGAVGLDASLSGLFAQQLRGLLGIARRGFRRPSLCGERRAAARRAVTRSRAARATSSGRGLRALDGFEGPEADRGQLLGQAAAGRGGTAPARRSRRPAASARGGRAARASPGRRARAARTPRAVAQPSARPPLRVTTSSGAHRARERLLLDLAEPAGRLEQRRDLVGHDACEQICRPRDRASAS